MSSRPVAFLVTALYLGAGGVAVGEDPRTDRYSDPLPSQAVARFGTLRLRHLGDASSVAFSPDGRMLVAPSNDAVFLWDVQTGRRLKVLQTPRGEAKFSPHVQAVAVAPDSRTIAVLHSNRVHLHDSATGEALRVIEHKLGGFFPGHPYLGFSPDGKLVAVASGDQCVLFDVAAGIEQQRVGGHKAAINDLAFSRDGTLLAVATMRPRVQLWDVASGRLTRGMGEDEQFAHGVAFSAAEDLVAAAGGRNVDIWEMATGKSVLALKGENERDLFLAVAFTPNGRRVVAASQEGQVYLWGLPQGKPQQVLDGRMGILRDMALSPDGKQIAASFAYHAIRVWDTETGMELHTGLRGHETEVYDVAFSPDGRTLATGGGNRQAFWWNPRTGENRPEFESAGSASSIEFSPDGRLFAAAWQYDPIVRIYDGHTSRMVRELTSTYQVKGLGFTGDGERLVAVGQNFKSHESSVNVWDVATGRRLVETTRTSPNYIRADCAAVAPDGSVVAVACGSTILYWDLATGAEAADWTAHDHNVTRLKFSSDGRWLISASLDQTVGIWDAGTRSPAHVLRGHERSVKAIAISPDGLTVASAGGAREYPLNPNARHRIRFWDLLTGEQVAELSGHDAHVLSLAFSPDGRHLASGHQDTTALVWTVPAEALLVPDDSRPLKGDEAERLWEQLKSKEVGEARAAMRRLISGADTTVRLLRDVLKPVDPPDPDFVQEQLRRLDSDNFDTRKLGSEELKKIARLIQQPLEAAMAETDSLEVRARCETLLEEARRPTADNPDVLRDIRAVHVLRLLGTADALELVRRVSRGATGAPLTEAATTAIRVDTEGAR